MYSQRARSGACGTRCAELTAPFATVRPTTSEPPRA